MRNRNRGIVALMIIIVMATTIIIYSGSEINASSTIIAESNDLGANQVVNATMSEVLFSTTNETIVNEQTVNSIVKPNTSSESITKENFGSTSAIVPIGITFGENPQDTIPNRYTIQKVSNGLTNLFGFAVQTGPDTITYFYRQGTTHAQDKGNVVMRSFIISSGTWSDASTLYSDPVLDSRNVGGGIINDKIYVFFLRYNYTTGSAKGSDVGYIVSTDLTGSSWSEYKPIVNNTSGSPYGTLVQKGQSSTWYLGYYVNNNNSSKLKLITSRDNGATWIMGRTVYNGSTYFAEPALAYLGNNKLLMIAREENDGPLHQFTSNNGGYNWTDSGDTNIGSNVTNRANIPSIQVNGNTVYVLWADRGTNKLMLSKSSFNVFNDASLYDIPIEIGSMENPASVGKGGYPSFVILDNGDLFYLYGNAVDNFTVDIMSRIIQAGSQ